MTLGTGRLTSINVVFEEIPDVGGSVGVTSIDKRPVTGDVTVTADGVSGDQRSDMEFHGSLDQAVYAFASEDYDWWSSQIDVPLHPGIFGENLTTVDVPVTHAVIGTIWQIGTAELKVTSPRIPCGTFTRWMNIEQWVKKFTQGGRPGAYLRVVTDGTFNVNDNIVVKSVPTHGVTISEVFEVMSGDRDQARVAAVADCEDVPQSTRDKVAKFRK